jgi:ABC-type dipeptide/oligopeptide/nickel transport system ATPase component
VIETHDLTKKYGDMFAIKSIELKLDYGDLFGFIGPNGAGKTTTMRIIATLLNPTWGEAYVCGNSIYTKPKEIRRLVGYMPDFFGVYDDMTVIEYLEFFAAAYRIQGKTRRERCDEISISNGTPMRTPFRAGKPSGWDSPEPCCTIPRCCCWTNPSAASIRGLELKCEASCDGSEKWARRSSSPATFCRKWPISVTRSGSSIAAC